MTTAGWALFFITIIVAVISRILAEDAKTFIPRLSQRLLRSAAQRINEDHAARFFEEWMAHLAEIPELSGKLWHSGSIYFWGSRQICKITGYSVLATSSYDRSKRRIDIGIIVLAIPGMLLLCAPVFFILYCQYGYVPIRSVERVGRGGKVFKLWKFSTMPKDAEYVLARHLTENAFARDEWRTTGQLKSDPRVTGFGKIVRKLSLDGVPQLWNVLKGDMSLIGPHPLCPECLVNYPGIYCEKIRPGISGAWQISESDEVTMENMARFDTEYVKDMSFSTDFGILLSTLAAVIRIHKD